MSAERPPGEEGPARDADSDPDAPAPPPPPWRRDAPAEPEASPAESSWRPYADDEEPVASAPAPEDPPPPPWRTEPATKADGEEAPPPWRRDEPTEPTGEEPPPPWRRDPPAEPETSPAESSWRPYADEAEEEPTEAHAAFGDEPAPAAEDAFGTPEPEPDLPPEPELEPDPVPPPPPRTGSVGPPGYEGPSGGATTLPAGVTAPPSRVGPEPVPGRHALAPWGLRAVAYILDGIIVGVVTTLIIVLITGAAGGVGFLGGDATGYGGLLVGFLFSTLIATAVALLYSPIWMVRTNGQTLGKQLMGIRVIRPDGRPIEFLYALVREVVVKTFLFAGLGGSITFGLLWLLDCLWPLWDDENRALHDMIVNSRVVRA